MKSFEYMINDELGIHARPAGQLVKEAKKFKSSIVLKKGEKEAAANLLLKIMSMGVKKGDNVFITIEGEDEEAAFEAMQNFFESNL